MKVVKLVRGSTWLRSWILKTRQTGQRIDLRGATATVQMWNARRQLIYTASTATGELVVDGLGGFVALTVDSVITTTWKAGTYSFAFKIKYPGGADAVYEMATLLIMGVG